MKATAESHSLVLHSLRPNNDGIHTEGLLQTLLEAGADPSAVDGPSGLTPLFWIIEKSLHRTHGRHIVHMSAYHIRLSASHIGLLLDTGADVHVPNTDGYTIADLINDHKSKWTMGPDIYRRLYNIFNSDYIPRREAVAMGLHPRLGGKSPINRISDDVMHKHIISKMAKTIPSTLEVFDHD